MNLRAKVFHGLFVVVYGAFDPKDDDWSRYLALVESHDLDSTRQLIYTDGGGPSAEQLQALSALLGERVVPTAVIAGRDSVQDSATVHMWVDSLARAFSLSSLADALTFLEVPTDEHLFVTRMLFTLRSEVEGTQGW